MLEQSNWIAAAIFYPLYTGGIVFFCVGPALAHDSSARASISGAFLGLVAYATYDLTNLATLRGWPAAVSVIDVLWGMFVSGVAATAGFLAARTLNACVSTAQSYSATVCTSRGVPASAASPSDSRAM